MNFETMILILAGRSKQVAEAYQKAMAPYVTGTTKHRQK